MRIMLASHSSTLQGGSERSLLEIAKFLIHSKNTEVGVIVPENGALQEALKAAGVAVFVTSYHWASTSKNTERRLLKDQVDISLSEIRKIDSIICEYKPDAFITNTSVIPWFAYVCSKRNIPHLWFIREKVVGSKILQYYPDTKSYVKFIGKSSKFILVNSQYTASLFNELLPLEKIRVVYPTIDSSISKHAHPEGKPRSITTPLQIIILGAISEEKNQLEALEAINILKKKLPIKLSIVGPRTSDRYYQILQRYIQKHSLDNYVKFIDYTEKPYEYIVKHDLLLVTSLAEPFGRITAEAMLLRVPVLASRTGGSPEIIIENKSGLLYESGNPIDLASKIEVLKKMPIETRQLMTEAAHKHASREYGSKKPLISLYKTIIEVTSSKGQPTYENNSWIDIEIYKALSDAALLRDELKLADSQLRLAHHSLDQLSKDYQDIIHSKKWAVVSSVGRAIHLLKDTGHSLSSLSKETGRTVAWLSLFRLKSVYTSPIKTGSSKQVDVAVIMCTWKRTINLPDIISRLDKQKNTNTGIRLYIWNNNPNARKEIEASITKYLPVASVKKIYIHHSRTNVGGFGRFYMAKKVTKRQSHEPIIFLDDDQLIDSGFLKTALESYRRKQLASFWAFRLKGSYWDREKIEYLQAADYCGTGGMIADSNIFHEKPLYTCPDEFWFMEDLWLTFYAKYKLNWDLTKLNVNIRFVDRANDQGLELVQAKEEFYNFLKAKYSTEDKMHMLK